jgi:hypothetical protein
MVECQLQQCLYADAWYMSRQSTSYNLHRPGRKERVPLRPKRNSSKSAAHEPNCRPKTKHYSVLEDRITFHLQRGVDRSSQSSSCYISGNISGQCSWVVDSNVVPPTLWLVADWEDHPVCMRPVPVHRATYMSAATWLQPGPAMAHALSQSFRQPTRWASVTGASF